MSPSAINRYLEDGMAGKESKAHAPQPVDGNGEKPSAIASFNDTIARNRGLQGIAPDEVPRAPEGYQATSVDERRRRLRLLDSALFAEAVEMMRELEGRAAVVKEDLGDLVPDPAVVPGLRARFEKAIATRKGLELAMAYNDEILAIAASDVVQHAEGVNDEYEHRAGRRPQLALAYPKLVSFFKARSTAISEGIARARKNPKGQGEGDGESGTP
jgi:hypothetical protein